jgi:hypothetical protein
MSKGTQGDPKGTRGPVDSRGPTGPEGFYRTPTRVPLVCTVGPAKGTSDLEARDVEDYEAWLDSDGQLDLEGEEDSVFFGSHAHRAMRGPYIDFSLAGRGAAGDD